ncbi:MAG: hypothetical protein ACOYJW_03365 [Candidatus Omnitrophota bacterium]
MGIGTSVSGFLKSGLQQLVLQGVSEMAVHVGLPPPLASALSLIATQSLNSFFDPGLTLKAGLLQIAPDVATQLTLGGLELLGRSIGLDPRITALMGLPVAAAVGGVTKDLLNPNGSNPGRIFDTIKDSIFSTKTLNGMISIGTSLAVDQLGLPPIASDLISGFITGFSQTKSGEKVFSKIGEGIKRFTGWITDGIRPVVDFGAKILNGAVEITEAGFKSAINAFGSFFSRPTQEYIYQDVAGIRSGSVSVDGDIWTWQSGDSRIDYNVRTGRVDETFGIGGTAKIEGLGQDALGNFYYSKLSSATAFDGGVLSQSYESGKLTEWGLLFPDGTSIVSRACNVNGWDFSGGVFNGNVENGEIIYYVPAPDLDANPTTHPARHATYTFYVQNGNVLPNVDARIVSGSGSQDTSDLVASMKPFYLLANGINNTENYQGSQNLIADYYRKLESDLVAKSSGTVTASDIVIPPLYPQVLHNWFSGLRTFANRTFDVLKVIAEGQLPQWHLAVVQSLMDGIRNFYNDRACAGENARTRPVVAVGYSGGMAPLLETISTLNIQTAAIIGAGTAIADITEIRETLETLIDTLEYVQKKVFSPVRGLLEMIFGNTVGKIPYVGDGINNTLEAFLGKIDELVQLAATPGVVLTDLIGTMIEEAVGRALDALRIQGRLRDLETIGLAQINSPGAVMMNVYGDRDLLKELNVGGYRDQIGSFTTALPTSNLINIEVVSYTGSSGKTAVADHYIYFGDTRNYDEIEDPEQRALQREYDGLVNDFMVELILASDSDVDRSKFLDRYESCLVQVSPGYYKYFPLGKA